MDAAGFRTLSEKRFFSENDITGGRDVSQNVQYCLTDPVIPSVTL